MFQHCFSSARALRLTGGVINEESKRFPRLSGCSVNPFPPPPPPPTHTHPQAYRLALYALGRPLALRQSGLSAAAEPEASTAADFQPQLAAAVGDAGLVILDEFQSISDRKRGTMWEEALLWSPPGLQQLALSSIVRGAETLQDWMSDVLGSRCELAVCEKVPSPPKLFFLRSGSLTQIGGRMSPAFTPEQAAAAQAASATAAAAVQEVGAQSLAATGQQAAAARAETGSKRPTLRYALWQLKNRKMLPAVFFIFSRAACNAAALEAASDRGVGQLLRPDEAEAVRLRLAAWQAANPGHGRAEEAAALTRGVAAHHSGLLPAWRELVEELAADGLVKLLFATETMAATLKARVEGEGRRGEKGGGASEGHLKSALKKFLTHCS